MVDFKNEIDEIILLNKNINYNLAQYGGNKKEEYKDIIKKNGVHIWWTFSITTFIILYYVIKEIIGKSNTNCKDLFDTVEKIELKGGENNNNSFVDNLNEDIESFYNDFYKKYIDNNKPLLIVYFIVFNLVLILIAFIGGPITEHGIYIPCMGCSKSTTYIKCLPGTGHGSISCDIYTKTLKMFQELISIINKIKITLIKIISFIQKTIIFIKNQIIFIYKKILFIFGLPAKFLKKMVRLIPEISLPFDFEINFGKLFINSSYSGDACVFEVDSNGNITNRLRATHGTNMIFRQFFKIMRISLESPPPFPKLDFNFTLGVKKKPRLTGFCVDANAAANRVSNAVDNRASPFGAIANAASRAIDAVDNGFSKRLMMQQQLKNLLKKKQQQQLKNLLMKKQQLKKLADEKAAASKKLADEEAAKKLAQEKLSREKLNNEYSESKKVVDNFINNDNLNRDTIENSDYEKVHENREKLNKEYYDSERRYRNRRTKENENNDKLGEEIKNDEDKAKQLLFEIDNLKNYIKDLKKPKDQRVYFKELDTRHVRIAILYYNNTIKVKTVLLQQLEKKIKSNENSYDKNKKYKLFLRIFCKIIFSPIKIILSLFNSIIWLLNNTIKYIIVIPIEFIIKQVINLVRTLIEKMIDILKNNVLNHILVPLGKIIPKLKTIPTSIYRIYTLIVDIGPSNLIFYGLFDLVNSMLGDILPYIGIIIICAVIITVLVVCPYLGLMYQSTYIIKYLNDIIYSIAALLYYLYNLIILRSKQYLESFRKATDYNILLNKILEDITTYLILIKTTIMKLF